MGRLEPKELWCTAYIVKISSFYFEKRQKFYTKKDLTPVFLRLSNTEPVIRLNVESQGDVALMEEKTTELLALIRE